MHLFEQELLVSTEDIEFDLGAMGALSWATYELNPRRLRGSDFLMRWSQGVWGEQRLVEAVNGQTRYYAIPYGPIGTAPQHDVRAFELYFEELEAAAVGGLKRPDLLVFPNELRPRVNELVGMLGGIERLPFHREDVPQMTELLLRAVLAVECENSLWISRQMPGYGREQTPQRRLGGRLGLPKATVLPTVIVKEEDRASLQAWEDTHKVPIHVWHTFFDDAYGLAFSKLQQMIADGIVEPKVQVFQAPGGATTRKILYGTPYFHAYLLGTQGSAPKLIADSISDKNGHILPFVRFDGGSIEITEEAIAILDSLSGGA